MQISTIVSIAVNVIFVLMLGLGFLFGFKRGVKRASVRIGLFVGFAVIGAVLSPFITQAILSIKFTWPSGMRGTILAYLESLVKSSEQISTFISQNTSLISSLRQIIIMVCNLLMFVIVAFLMKFISWIVYKIIEKYAISGKKKKQTLEDIKKNTTNSFDLSPKPEKRYRLWGSLVGLVQGLVFAFIVFLPISGLVSTFNSVLETASTETSATTVSTVAVSSDSRERQNSDLPATVGDLVLDYLPSEVLDCVQTYRKSAIGAISSVGNLDAMCFDAIASYKVNNVKVVIRQEILNACDLYKDFVYFYNYDFANDKIKDLDFTKADSLIDGVLQSKLVSSISQDVVPYCLEKFVVNNDELKFGDLTGTVKDSINKFSSVLKRNSASEINADIKAVYNIGKLVAKDGIIDDIRNDGFNITKLLDKATQPKTEGTIITQSINYLLSTESLKVALNGGLNCGIKALENSTSKQIGSVKYDEDHWKTASTEAIDFANNLTSMYNYFNSLDSGIKDKISSFSLDEEMFDALKQVDLQKLINPIAKDLDILKKSKLMNAIPQGDQTNTTPLFNRVVLSVYDSDLFNSVRNYVDLRPVVNNNYKFEDSFTKITSVLKVIIEKDVISNVVSNNGDISKIFDSFKSDSNPNPATFDEVFAPLIDNEILRPTIITGLNKINSLISDVLNTGLPVYEISLDTNVLAQKADIKDFWNSALPLSDALFMEGGFNIEDLDFDKLSSLLETLKINTYSKTGNLKEDSVLQGIYLNLIKYMKNNENYGDNFNDYYGSFENPYDVNWKVILTAVKAAIDLSSDKQEISVEVLGDLIDLVENSDAINKVVKDAIIGFVDEDLKDDVENLDLTSNITKGIIKEISNLATALQKLEDGNKSSIFGDATTFIGNLNKCEDQTTVEVMMSVVDNVASGTMKEQSSKISEQERMELKGSIEAATKLSSETKSLLKSLFGIEDDEE